MEGQSVLPQNFDDQEELMIRKEEGFTLVELLITMIVFVFVISAASTVFTHFLTQFKQQSKMAQTATESMAGLEIFRQDLEDAGYGLPWNLNGASYQEAAVENLTAWVDRDFNDGPPTNPQRGGGSDPGGADLAGASNPPAGIRSRAGYGLNQSDVIVIKATNIANLTAAGSNPACSEWTLLSGAATYVNWSSQTGENLSPTDRVVVMSPGSSANGRTLISDSSGSFWTPFSGVTSPDWIPANYNFTNVVYGVDSNTDLRMPFNRADYYIRIPSASDPKSSCSIPPVRMEEPSRCAPNTGVLIKAVLKQSDGTHCEMPLLDCVAGMHVVYALDNYNNAGSYDGFDILHDSSHDTYGDADSIAFSTAAAIRNQVKEIRVYILAQEGQMDRDFTFSNFNGGCSTCVNLGEDGIDNQDFDLSALTPGSNDYLHYRWKVYTIVATPKNLSGM